MSDKDFGFTFHFDLGLELIPKSGSNYSFLLKGKDCREVATRLIKFKGHPDFIKESFSTSTREELLEYLRDYDNNNSVGDDNTENPHVLLNSFDVSNRDLGHIDIGMSSLAKDMPPQDRNANDRNESDGTYDL